MRINEGNTSNKWIKLQTACVEHLFIIYSCIAHVEHVGQDLVAAEEEEAEEVYQEGLQQQFKGEDQEQNQELTNFYNTQGKHRCMKTQYHLQSSLTIITVLMHLSL